ncbi:MAG: hypothetical protein A2Y33_11765 [Spirochaetes bacterium GWF1_51_8]|nr:MAG: hypothetical protein A2Y33_11765 [Spirochaetes bacterium GWF1_51_8]
MRILITAISVLVFTAVFYAGGSHTRSGGEAAYQKAKKAIIASVSNAYELLDEGLTKIKHAGDQSTVVDQVLKLNQQIQELLLQAEPLRKKWEERLNSDQTFEEAIDGYTKKFADLFEELFRITWENEKK